MSKRLQWAYPAVIVVLCILTRLPQLFSPYLLLDGDECVLATMARYLYHGKNWSLFFWGQNYGFSFIESAAIVPFYALFGVSALSVKCAMLLLWTTGVLFFYKALLCINTKGRILPLLITLLLIASPAWAVWSMKARGGYITAFLLCNIATYLLFHPSCTKKASSYLLTGLIISLIYQSQLFWLAGLLPLAAYRLFRERSMLKALCLVMPVVIISSLFHYYKASVPEGYTPGFSPPDTSIVLTERLMRLPEYFYSSLHGNYYFSYYQSPNLFCALFAALISALILVLTICGFYFLLLKRHEHRLFICAVSAFPACALYSLFTRDMEGRYLLPLTGCALLALQVFMNGLRYRKWMSVGLTGFAVAGFIAAITFRDFQFLPYTRKDLMAFLNQLKAQGIHYTFCTRTMVPWQITFYSNEAILSRTSFDRGRFAPYHEGVNNAYYRGKKTAVVGLQEDIANLHITNAQSLSGDLFICTGMPDRKLRQLFILPGR